MKREKAINTAIRVTPSEKADFERIAKERGITLTDLLLDGARLLGTLDVDFLKQMQTTAEKVKLPVATVIQQLLLAYVAADAAIIARFGVSKTFQRAFQFNENGLITGNELSNLVFSQVAKAIDGLMEHLEETTETGDRAFIARDQAALIAARL